MKQIGEALKNDPGLERDLNGYRKFRDQVRAALTEDTVPTARLVTALHKITAEEPTRKTATHMRISLAAAFVAASLVVGALVARNSFEHDPFNLARTPEVEQYSPKTEVDGVNWIRQNPLYAELPNISISSNKLKFSVARLGEDWACIDYIIDNEPVRLYVAPNHDPSRPVSRTISSQGVAWSTKRYSFALKGNQGVELTKLAERLMKG